MEVRTALGRALRSQWHHYQQSSTLASRSHASPCRSLPLLQRRPFLSSATHWQARTYKEAAVSQHLDSALDLKTDSAASTRQNQSHFASPLAQKERQAERSGATGLSSTVDEMLYELGNSDLKSPPSVSGNQQALAGRRAGDHMLMGNLLMGNPGSKLDPLQNTVIRPQPLLPLPLTVRLGPNLGRTVKVSPQRDIDVAKAFRMLNIQVRRNRVIQDFRKQQFHERPGLKRKRVRSERWRATFKEGFKGMVARVKKMKRQGW